ncbi:MAG: alkaline phosphatase family protein [Vicinamibacterales bacterium]
MSGRLLVVGLDAGDADLIDRWIAEGRLPHLARLKAGGSWTRLGTTAEMFHVSAWPSIFTGTTADKHGLYHAYVTRPGHQGLIRPRADSSPFPFLWKVLDDHGRRSVVMDAFLTCPLRPFNGVQIVDWGSWSWFWEPTMIPASLADEIRTRFGPYPADDHSKVGVTPVSDVGTFRQRLLAAVERKTAVVRWLMEREAWDLFLVVFGECHPAGHYFWHLYDETYLTHPEPGGLTMRDALRDVYVALDRAFGALADAAGPDTTVMLVSGDGMCANYSGSHLLPDLLTRMGALNAPDAGADAASAPPAHGRRDPIQALRNLVPERLRHAISTALLSREMQERLSLRWKTAGIAWPRTRAYVIENANEGYIRLNLRGREPDGIVEPGADYDRWCDEICATARTMTHPGTGRPAALAVHKTAELFDGPCADHLPDIVIVWDIGARVTTALLTERYGLVQVAEPACAIPPYYTGNHCPNAFAAVRGPGIAPGAPIAHGHVLDLAPTILAHYGIPAPAHMDGHVLEAWTPARA